jgi:hypothetical protein
MRAARASGSFSARTPMVAKQATRTFVTSRQFRQENISAKEVHFTSYDADGKAISATIPVSETPAVEIVDEVDESVTPLTREVYDAMTPTMKKTTVMDKLVIITG